MAQEAFEKLYMALINFLVLSKHQMIDMGSEHGLTRMQTQTLLYLCMCGAQPMNNLGSMFGCDPSNITGVVDGLERKQLIRRTEKPGDRRVKLLQLEPKGSAVCSALINQLTDKNNYIFSKLNADEIAQFTAILQKLTQDFPKPQAGAL
jgi:DNA-binding MarR family transcriptional regulator